MKRHLSLVYLLVTLLTLSACAWLPKQKDETKGWSANKLYTTAKTLANKGDYQRAIKYYVILEARYPFGKYAQQGQLELTYAYYKNEDFDQALAAATRFIKLHPTHPRLDYIYYLKGLINYRQKTNMLTKIFPVDPSTRDPGAARQSFFDFKELVKKFPNSKYAEDARKRMLFLRNNLAKHEINVAKYYIKRGAYVAAANRAKYVIQHYNDSPSVQQALETMVISYERLQLKKLRDDALRVLKKNFPNHPLLGTNARKRKRWIKKWTKKAA